MQKANTFVTQPKQRIQRKNPPRFISGTAGQVFREHEKITTTANEKKQKKSPNQKSKNPFVCTLHSLCVRTIKVKMQENNEKRKLMKINNNNYNKNNNNMPMLS
jgi:hypothetical protein